MLFSTVLDKFVVHLQATVYDVPAVPPDSQIITDVFVSASADEATVMPEGTVIVFVERVSPASNQSPFASDLPFVAAAKSNL